MTDKIDEIKTDVTEDISTADVVKPEKKYTDEDVQRMVRERIAREKDASKKALEDATNAKTSLEQTLAKYEEILAKQVEAKAGSLPEVYKKLFDKLSLTEKIEFLAELSEDKQETKTQFPKTPTSNSDGIPTQKTIKKFI